MGIETKAACPDLGADGGSSWRLKEEGEFVQGAGFWVESEASRQEQGIAVLSSEDPRGRGVAQGR